MPRQSATNPAPADLALRAFLLGVSAGSRTMVPHGVMALRQPGSSARWAQRVPLRWPIGRAGLVVGMLSEFVADKLPQTPSRLEPGALAGRVVSGVLAGSAIGGDGGAAGVRTGAILGGVGALAGSFGGYWGRRIIVTKTGLPDLPVALLEDCTALGLAAIATDRYS